MPKAKTTTAKRPAAARRVQYHYTVIFEPAEEGGFIAKIPALNGIATQGGTFEEARAMAEDLIRGYLECLRNKGEEIPVEYGYPIVQRVSVSLPSE